MSLNFEDVKKYYEEEPETEEPETEEPTALDILEGKVMKCEEGLLDAMKGVKKDFDLDRSRIDELENKVRDLEGVIGDFNNKLGGDDLLIKPTAWDKAHPVDPLPIGSPVDAFKVEDDKVTVIDEDIENVKRWRTILRLTAHEIMPTWAWKYLSKEGKVKYVELTPAEAEALEL